MPKPAKPIKFYYVVSARLADDHIRDRFTKRLIQTQGDFPQQECSVYHAAIWNLLTLELSPAPVMQFIEPNAATMRKIVSREMKQYLLDTLGHSGVDKLGLLRNGLLVSLGWNPGRAHRLFSADLKVRSAGSGLRYQTTVEHHVDTTLVTLCSQQVRKFFQTNQIAKEMEYRLMDVVCDGNLPATSRIRESIGRATLPPSTAPGWRPPSHSHHYPDVQSKSVHALGGGQFESKRGKF